MAGLYTVLPGPDSAAVEQQVAAELTGVTRRYYVAAEEVRGGQQWMQVQVVQRGELGQSRLCKVREV